MKLLCVSFLVIILTGCAGKQIVENGTAESKSENGGAGGMSGLFEEPEPVLPVEDGLSGVAIENASYRVDGESGNPSGLNGVVRLHDPEEGITQPPPRVKTISMDHLLAESVKKLEPYSNMKYEDIGVFSRLRLTKLQRRALLLVLLTGRYDSEDFRKIYRNLEKFQITNSELEALKYAFYQHLGEEGKRDEALNYLVSESNKGHVFKLENPHFCKKVVAYRQYVNVDKAIFKPGDELTIYCEFRGANCRSLPGGKREQQIQAYLSVLKSDKKIVDTLCFLSAENGKRTLLPEERFDTGSYLTGTYILPSSIQPGNYTMRISATDMVRMHKKQTEVGISFEIVKAGDLR